MIHAIQALFSSLSHPHVALCLSYRLIPRYGPKSGFAAAAVGMLGIPGSVSPCLDFCGGGEGEGGIGKHLSKAEGGFFFSNLIEQRSAKEGGNWVKAPWDCKAPEARG